MWKAKYRFSIVRHSFYYLSQEMNTNDDNNLETTIKIDDDETIVPLPSDAEILFTIAGRVQIFYISADGNVSAPSYPSTLFIFKFKSEYSG